MFHRLIFISVQNSVVLLLQISLVLDVEGGRFFALEGTSACEHGLTSILDNSHRTRAIVVSISYFGHLVYIMLARLATENEVASNVLMDISIRDCNGIG
jgi:hypothetical protein